MNTTNEGFSRGQGAFQQPAPGYFWRNLEMIRPVAWVIAIAMGVGLWAIMWFVAFPDNKPDMANIPFSVQVLFSILPGLVIFIYVLLIGFVHVDAKRRGMRYIMWTLLAIFIPNTIGIILYFILRDPLPTPCPKCGYLARGNFSFCPDCGTELLRACRVCHKKVELGWTNCAYCGTPISAQIQRPA